MIELEMSIIAYLKEASKTRSIGIKKSRMEKLIEDALNQEIENEKENGKERSVSKT